MRAWLFSATTILVAATTASCGEALPNQTGSGSIATISSQSASFVDGQAVQQPQSWHKGRLILDVGPPLTDLPGAKITTSEAAFAAFKSSWAYTQLGNIATEAEPTVEYGSWTDREYGPKENGQVKPYYAGVPAFAVEYKDVAAQQIESSPLYRGRARSSAAATGSVPAGYEKGDIIVVVQASTGAILQELTVPVAARDQ